MLTLAEKKRKEKHIEEGKQKAKETWIGITYTHNVIFGMEASK